MNIGEAMEAIADLQKGLSVDVGGFGGFGAQTIVSTYAFVPSGRKGRVSVPCWLNEWSFNGQEMANSSRLMRYTIRSRLLLAETSTDLEAWGRIAAAFHQAFCDSVGQSVMLRDSNAYRPTLRGAGASDGSGTFVIIPWNNADHYGLEYLMDLVLQDNFEAYP